MKIRLPRHFKTKVAQPYTVLAPANIFSVVSLCSLANSAYAPEIKKLLPHSITGAPSVGMGICEWGKVEFFNFGLPFLAIFSLKGPE